MNPTPTTSDDDIAALYAGPFADFISARDAFAKQLRAAGDKDRAAAVKGLRKPSRVAWALNRVVHHHAERLNDLDDAVAALVEAHAGSGDVRSAMGTLREAVRSYAAQAADQAQNEGFRLDVGDLSNAILATLGSPTSYEELRNGRLTDIPEAGGLDFLASLPARPKLEVSARAAPTKAASQIDAAEAEDARRQARATSQTLEKARVAAEAAAVALEEAESAIANAEEMLRAAQAGLKEALQRRAFARKAKESAAAELRAAEAADETAQRRLRTLTPN